MLVAFLLRHNLTDAALIDLLDMLNLFLPSAFPSSKYKFYKAIQIEDSKVRGIFQIMLLTVNPKYVSLISPL